ncbi:unnamed protein product [Camellia sinensis]
MKTEEECLAAEETVAAPLAASVAAAVEGCGMYPDIEKSTTTTTTIAGVAPPVKMTQRGLRRALELKEVMLATVDQTASVTHATVKMTWVLMPSLNQSTLICLV